MGKKAKARVTNSYLPTKPTSRRCIRNFLNACCEKGAKVMGKRIDNSEGSNKGFSVSNSRFVWVGTNKLEGKWKVRTTKTIKRDIRAVCKFCTQISGFRRTVFS